MAKTACTAGACRRSADMYVQVDLEVVVEGHMRGGCTYWSTAALWNYCKGDRAVALTS